LVGGKAVFSGTVVPAPIRGAIRFTVQAARCRHHAAARAERDHQSRGCLPYEEQEEYGRAERAAAFAGEPDVSCMARIVDKLRRPGNILSARSRDF